MASNPTQVANLVLDSLGKNLELGNIAEGGRIANVCLRAYRKCRRDLLRGAPWAFARKEVPLLMLADASGNTQSVGTSVPGGRFQYEYGYPIDCARLRYIPWNALQNPGAPAGNIAPANPSVPPMSGPQSGMRFPPIRPSQFLVTNDPNFPSQPGADGEFAPGQSPAGSTVILSNVNQANCVYTFDAVYPSIWDGLFTSAMIAYMASECVMAVWSDNDKKAIGLRRDQIAIAKDKILQARIADGNEMTTNVDHIPDWIRARRGYGSVNWNGNDSSGGDWGCWGAGWSGSMSFSDGSSY